jgi:hypothetical protein
MLRRTVDLARRSDSRLSGLSGLSFRCFSRPGRRDLRTVEQAFVPVVRERANCALTGENPHLIADIVTALPTTLEQSSLAARRRRHQTPPSAAHCTTWEMAPGSDRQIQTEQAL